MNEILTLTAAAIAAKVKAREISAREVTEAFLARIEAVDNDIQAFVTVTPEASLKAADAVDAKIAAGEDAGSLAGAPVALKDNLCTRGIEKTLNQ
jgi:aspartyl-tRNA(Asn)/glutamyl-tRNA(Gln) amidotransferase subunit A